MWHVYILKSTLKRWYYVGSTNRLQQRLIEHNSGKVRSTKGYRPLELVKEFVFDTEKASREYEHLLKSKRLEKEGIIGQIEGA